MMPEDAYEARVAQVAHLRKRSNQLADINEFCKDTASKQKTTLEQFNKYPFDILVKDDAGNFIIPQPLNERDKIMFAAGQLSLALFIQGATE